MNKMYALMLSTAIVFLATLMGCARSARTTEGFSMVDSAVYQAPFVETWQAVKAVLRESDLDIYTRDKRGTFVAYTPMKRYLRVLTPERTKYTITVEQVTADSTRVSIETIEQVYGVTLLTHPDWHDRKTADNRKPLAILEAITAKLS